MLLLIIHTGRSIHIFNIIHRTLQMTLCDPRRQSGMWTSLFDWIFLTFSYTKRLCLKRFHFCIFFFFLTSRCPYVCLCTCDRKLICCCTVSQWKSKNVTVAKLFLWHQTSTAGSTISTSTMGCNLHVVIRHQNEVELKTYKPRCTYIKP